jgi:hypothetical protein
VPPRSRGSLGRFVGDRPAHIVRHEVEGLGQLIDILTGRVVLPQYVGADTSYCWAAETDSRSHAYGRAAVFMWPPTNRQVVIPVNPFNEELRGGG